MAAAWPIVPARRLAGTEAAGRWRAHHAGLRFATLLFGRRMRRLLEGESRPDPPIGPRPLIVRPVSVPISRSPGSCALSSTPGSRARGLGPLIDPNLHSCALVPPHGHASSPIRTPSTRSASRATAARRPSAADVMSRLARARPAGDMAGRHVQLVCPKPAYAHRSWATRRKPAAAAPVRIERRLPRSGRHRRATVP